MASSFETARRPASSAGYSDSSMTTPLAPLAMANTVSLVEHSPSTVMALNVSRVTAVSAFLSIAGSTCASHVRNPSMVAIIGSIMPEPFVMPPTWNVPAAVSTFTAASFGNGSVVMIASIALRCASRLSAASAFVTPSWTFSRLRSTPMTPVDATSTSSGRHPIWRATNSTVERATAMPASPVHAFAHPLLQTIALARPPERSRFARETMTGAACVLFVVNTAAADTGRSAVITITSSGQACVGGLMPA